MHILFLKKDFNFVNYDSNFFSLAELQPSNFDEELDYRIHTFLLNNKENNIKSITLPISLTDNYMEFSGLIFAHHLRLTRELKFCDVPIIFYGGLELEQILKITPFARILLSINVNYVNISKYSFKQIQVSIDSYKVKKLDFSDLLNYLYIDLPTNYDSHHSTANEWALFRYTSLIENIDSNLKYLNLIAKVKDLNYLKTLHFKYLEALSERQKINPKKHTYTPVIKGIESKKIAIIDDEINKGWFEFYDYLFSINNSSIEIFFGFKDDSDRNFLIERIKKWIKRHIEIENPVNLFIIDLRLHDDDFSEKDFDKLSGIQLIKYIKSENPGIQIVVSTASNKVWSFQNCMKYNVTQYAVKESPEVFYSRLETKSALDHFCDQIEKASQKTFLAGLYSDINQLKVKNVFLKTTDSDSITFRDEVFGRNGLFDQFFKIIELNPFIDTILNHCLLLCFQIFEKYCELRAVGIFNFKNRSAQVCLSNHTLEKIFVSSEDNKSILTKLRLIRGKLEIQTKESDETIKSFEILNDLEIFNSNLAIDTTSLVKIISVLSFKHGIPKHEIDRIIQLRYFRSNVSAHLTGNVKNDVKLTSDDFIFLVKIFKTIFLEQCN
jgi:hypothetical protein